MWDKQSGVLCMCRHVNTLRDSYIHIQLGYSMYYVERNNIHRSVTADDEYHDYLSVACGINKSASPLAFFFHLMPPVDPVLYRCWTPLLVRILVLPVRDMYRKESIVPNANTHACLSESCFSLVL